MKRSRQGAVLVCTLLSATGVAKAQSGTLDSTFGTNGLARLDLGAPRYAQDLTTGDSGALFATGAIVDASSHQRAFVLKLTDKGMGDAAFGSGGLAPLVPGAKTDFSWGRRILARAGGAAVIVGDLQLKNQSEDYFAAAFLADGTLDTSFGSGGVRVGDVGGGVERSVAGVATASSGLVVAGHSGPSPYLTLYGFSADGRRDDAFGTGGRVIVELHDPNPQLLDLAIDSRGRLLLLARFERDCSDTTRQWHAVYRFQPNGQLDRKFGDTASEGRKEVCLGTPMNFGALTVSGKRVLVAGASSDELLVAALDDKGRFETSFGGAGDGVARWPLPSPSPFDMLVEPKGRIVLVGTFGEESFVARLTKAGRPDTTFGTKGVLRVDASGGPEHFQSVARQTDGKLVAFGEETAKPTSVYLIRVLP